MNKNKEQNLTLQTENLSKEMLNDSQNNIGIKEQKSQDSDLMPGKIDVTELSPNSDCDTVKEMKEDILSEENENLCPTENQVETEKQSQPKNAENIKKITKYTNFNQVSIEVRNEFKQENDLTDEDVDQVFADPLFKSVYDVSDTGSLSKVYYAYVYLRDMAEALAEQKAKLLYIKSKTSPGSVRSNNLTQQTNWADLSKQEFERYISDAKKGYYTKK